MSEPGNILYYAAVTVHRRTQLRHFRTLFHSWRVHARDAGRARVIVWLVMYMGQWLSLRRRSELRCAAVFRWFVIHLLRRWSWWRWWRRYGSIHGGRLSTRRCGRYFR